LGQLKIAFSSPCRSADIALVDGVRKIQVQGRRGRTGFMNLATLAAPVEPEWLMEIMPHLCTRVRLGDHTYNEAQDVVQEQERTMFQGDLELVRGWVESADNTKSVEVFADWLARQRSLPNSPLDAVLRSNAARQERARLLNVRSGENTFKVYSQSEIGGLFVEALSGARRVAEVVDADVLALPALNEEEVALVLLKNPEVINLLGDEVLVEYHQSYSGLMVPKVQLSEEMMKANSWIHLPDEGVLLPGGRSVEVTVYVTLGWHTDSFADTCIPQLKGKVFNHLNSSLWEAWQKPSIELPSVEDVDSVVPFVVAVYGNCVVTGRPLMAYGTISERSAYRYNPSDPYFQVMWFRSIDQAQVTCHASCLKLDKLKTEEAIRIQEESEKVALTHECSELKEAVKRMCVEFRDELYDIEHYTAQEFRNLEWVRPVSVAELKQFFSKATDLMVRVKEEIAEVQAKRAEEARKKAEAEARENEIYKDLFAIIGSDDLRMAKTIDNFVRAALKARPQDAVRILERERDAGYGRDRRREAIEKAFPEIDHQWLEWKCGCDIVPVAAWAAYLTSRKNGTSKQQKAVDPVPSSVGVSTVDELRKAFNSRRF